MKDRVGQKALDRALDENALLLVYQPIHVAETKAVHSVEALLRQRRESGEIREASIIASTAEKGPELYALDSWVVHQAYSDAARWHSNGSPDVRLNVNLSPREFEDRDMLHHLRSLIDDCRIDTHKINLELTETSYISKPDETMKVLQELKKLGISLWLDDFGTGHSSITHLQKFPVDGLKLPKEFIEGLPDDEKSVAIASRLIEMSHDLGITVTAEGVETEPQYQFLLEHGCDFIQGFLFSKPMPVEELEKFLAE